MRSGQLLARLSLIETFKKIETDVKIKLQIRYGWKIKYIWSFLIQTNGLAMLKKFIIGDKFYNSKLFKDNIEKVSIV